MDKVLLVATGGTIAMGKNAEGKIVPAVSGSKLLSVLSDLNEDIKFEVVEFSNLASCNMSPEKMLNLAQLIENKLSDANIRGVIITHGTDTLEETAFFLDVTILDTRPIVLTASQRDLSESDSDGPRNLMNSIRVALHRQAAGRGVLISLNQKIYAAREVRKLHTSHLEAFNSGEVGALGNIDENHVIWHRKPEPTIKLGLPNQLADVGICKAYTGMPPSILDQWKSCDGLVIEGFGRGNLPPQMVEPIRSFVQQGKPVVITSRCLFGRTALVYGYPGGGGDLEKAGAWFAADLSTEKVRLLLSIAIGHGLSFDEIRQIIAEGGIQ